MIPIPQIIPNLKPASFFSDDPQTNLTIDAELLPYVFQYCTPKIIKSSLDEKIEFKTYGF